MLQEAHSLKNNCDSLRKKFLCPSITRGLIRLLINTLHPSIDRATMLHHLDFPFPSGVQIPGAGNTIPRKLSLIRKQDVREDT